MINKVKLFGLGLAFLATFLWAASKIILKLALFGLPPYTLLAGVSIVSALVLWIYYMIKRPAVNFYFADKKGQVLALIAIVGYVAAPLFSVIGLQYVSAATAGLFASASVLLVIAMSSLVLREKPNWGYLVGVTVVILGAYLFLSTKVFNASWLGVTMTLLAETGFALSTVLTRFISKGVEHSEIVVPIIGNSLAGIFLIPVALMTDFATAQFSWTALVSVVTVGIIFAFAGMIWAEALERVKAFEASIFQSSMAAQVGVLSMIFIGEIINPKGWIGVGLVLLGVLLIDGKAVLDILKRWYGIKTI